MLQLTSNEATAVVEFISDNLCKAIREDATIDNVDWIADIASAYRKLSLVHSPQKDEDSDW